VAGAEKTNNPFNHLDCRGEKDQVQANLSQSEVKVEFRNFVKGSGDTSVTSFSSHTGKAKSLKFGMHIPHMDDSKVTIQIFDILPLSCDI